MKEIITLYLWTAAIYSRKRFQGITSQVASLLPAKRVAENTINCTVVQSVIVCRGPGDICVGDPIRGDFSASPGPRGTARNIPGCPSSEAQHHQARSTTNSSSWPGYFLKYYFWQHFTFLWSTPIAVLVNILQLLHHNPSRNCCS